MTTENDEVSQDQESLDQEQGIQAETPVSLTAEQVTEIVKAQTSALEAQIRGVQSIESKAANAIRNDMEALVDRKFTELQTNMGRQAYLNNLDEHDRALVEPLLAEMDRRNTPEPTPVATPNPTLVQQWEPVIQYVESLGLARNDTRIQYTMLAAPDNQVDTTKFNAFRDHLVALRSQDMGSTPTSQPAAQNSSPPATANPPVESGGQASSGALNTPDQVRDAFIMHQIDKETYLEKMAGFGEPA